MGEIELIHYEAYKDQSDARRRELYLKTTQGKRIFKIMLRNSLSKIKKD
jgi:predicted GIY-YIG superfamily endonuclease